MSNISYAVDNLRDLVDVYDDLDDAITEFVATAAGEIVTTLIETTLNELVDDAVMNEFDCVVRDTMAGASDLLDVEGHIQALREDVTNALENEALATLKAEMSNLNLGGV